MPGRDFYITTPALMAAKAEYEAGWTAEEIARRRWQDWGYADVTAASRALRNALRQTGVVVRGKREENERRVLHGDYRRALSDPRHPEHDRYLGRRRMLDPRKREAANSGVSA